MIQLTNQQVEVESCNNCNKLMVNLDADQLAKGDLTTLKRAAILVSNPDTDDTLCISCEYRTFGRRIADFFESDDDDDDSSFFGGGGFGDDSDSGSSFGGFGGFGGGSFSGGGASSSW